MLGGRRVVRVRGAGNALAKLFEGFLADPKGDALVVVEGGRSQQILGATQGVREPPRMARRSPVMPTIARNLAGVVREAMTAEGLTITADAVEDAVSRLGSDRGITRRELEKLALYAKDAGQGHARGCPRRRWATKPRRASRRSATLPAKAISRGWIWR